MTLSSEVHVSLCDNNKFAEGRVVDFDIPREMLTKAGAITDKDGERIPDPLDISQDQLTRAR